MTPRDPSPNLRLPHYVGESLRREPKRTVGISLVVNPAERDALAALLAADDAESQSA